MGKLFVTLSETEEEKIRGKLDKIAKLCAEVYDDLRHVKSLSFCFSKEDEHGLGWYFDSTGCNDSAIIKLTQSSFISPEEVMK